MESLVIAILTNKYLIIGVTILAALIAICIAGWLARFLIKPALIAGIIFLVGIVLYSVDSSAGNRVISKAGVCFDGLKKHTEQASKVAVGRIRERVK